MREGQEADHNLAPPHKNKMNEHELQTRVVEWCRLSVLSGKYPELAFIHAIPNGIVVSKRERARLINEGLLSGVCDLFLPVARGGFFGLYIEMKTPTGKLETAQKTFIQFVQKQGYKVVIPRSIEEAIAAVADYMEKEDTI